jgi:hypothetical protein
MQLIFKGNDCMLVSSVYLQGLHGFVRAKYLHTLKPNIQREQYMKITNIKQLFDNFEHEHAYLNRV